MTPEQLDEIEKLAATWLGKEKDFYATGRDAAMHQFIRAMRKYALPLVKALREAQAAADIAKAFHDVAVKERDYERVRANRIEKERDEARARLSHLLARIHRDGGHYEVKNGTAKATEDAEKIVVEDRQAYVSWRDTAMATAQERDEARAEVERLKQLAREAIDFAVVLSGAAPDEYYWEYDAQLKALEAAKP